MTEFRTALITGASAGIGAAFAHRLADGNTRLILNARRADKLEALAAEIKGRAPVEIEILPADLAQPDEVAQLADHLRSLDNLDLLVNNAGFGLPGDFAEHQVADHLRMIQVHVNASVSLSHAVIQGMIARQRGAIINVASVAALLPASGGVTYSATKAYLVAFSQSLSSEIRVAGVKVQALCPGFTYTEFHDVMGVGRPRLPKFAWHSANYVVDASLKALRRGQVVCVPGPAYQFVATFANSPLIGPLIFSIVRTVRKRKSR
jgi:hypothetical protein